MCENDKEDVLVNQAESGAQEIEETVNAEGIITSVDDVDKGVNIDACTISTGVYVMPKIIVHSNILLDTRASTTGTELQKYPPKEVIENSTVQDEECSVEEEGAAATVRKKKKRLAILDSDSDEGEDTVTKTNSHKIAICNSDNLSGGEENSTLKDKVILMLMVFVLNLVKMSDFCSKTDLRICATLILHLKVKMRQTRR